MIFEDMINFPEYFHIILQNINTKELKTLEIVKNDVENGKDSFKNYVVHEITEDL